MEVGTYDIHIYGSLHDDQGAMGRASELASCAPKMASLNCVQKRGCASWEIEHKSGAYLSCQHVSQIIECVGNSPLIMSVHPSIPTSIHPSIHLYLPPSIHPSLPPSLLHPCLHPSLEEGRVGSGRVQPSSKDQWFIFSNRKLISCRRWMFFAGKNTFYTCFPKKILPKISAWKAQNFFMK